jgi:hypothetical protein
VGGVTGEGLVRSDPSVEFFSLVAWNSLFVLLILLIIYAASQLRR